MKIKTSSNENEYLVKDLYESGYLYASNIPLLRLEKQGKIYFFVFENRNTCESMRDEFWSYSTSIDAKRYADAIKSLKERMFSNVE